MLKCEKKKRKILKLGGAYDCYFKIFKFLTNAITNVVTKVLLAFL